MPAFDRARVVCTNCHLRKIKCDLQTSPSGVCGHCRRSQQPCTRRVGVRNTQPSGTRLRAARSPSTQPLRASNIEVPSSDTVNSHSEAIHAGGSNSTPSSQSNTFISRCSNAYYEESGDITGVEEASTTTSAKLREALLKSVQLDLAPRPVLVRTWADTYWKHVFHYCPVLEEKDLDGSNASTTIGRAICLVGNLMRHNPGGSKVANELYEEVKLLIYLNHDIDAAQTLKVMCLLALWSAKPSNPITLDGPWHWIAVAIRLALQMGLHRECTYSSRSDAKCLRRIFWTLHNSDTLVAACWNRPPLLRRNDFDVELPTRDGSDISNLSLVFIESTKLCITINHISELHRDRKLLELEECSRIEVSLCDWVRGLSEELQLFDRNGKRKDYCRPVSELMIQYFVAIILCEFLRYRDRGGPRRVSVTSLLAASCAAALYEEIECRDEAVLLPHHNGFYCLIFGLPIIHYIPQSMERKAARHRDLVILRAILKGMDGRYGDAKWCMTLMENLKTSIDRAPGSQRPENSEHLEPSAVATLLFPFPAEFCDNMALLEHTRVRNVEFSAESLDPWQDWSVDNGTFDYTWLDLFRFDVADTYEQFENGDQ